MQPTQLQVNQKPSVFPDLRQLAAWAAAICILSGCVSLLNSHSWASGGVTVIWLTNGFVLGVVLCAPRRQWPVILLVSGFLDVVLNLVLSKIMIQLPFFSPASVISALYLSFCNTLEISLAAILLHRSISPDPDLTRPRQLIRLLLFGVVFAPAIASLLATIGGSGKFGAPDLHAVKYWFIADALGIATVTPLYLSFHHRHVLADRSWREVFALFFGLGITIVTIFGQSRYPLLFLIFPILLLIGMRLRLAGSALGLLIASVAGGYMTVSGRGPVSLAITSLTNRIVFFQLFIAVAMLVLYIMEITTAESYRLRRSLQASELRFRLLAEVSSDIIILSNRHNVRQYVSPAVTDLLGWQPSELVSIPPLPVIHPDDVGSMNEMIHQCLDGQPANGFVYRMQKKDSSYLWVEANVRLYRDSETGKPAGFVSVIRDFSRHKAAEDELNNAFRLVESLASVDALTGIANRRVFDETLDMEWRRSVRSDSQLSLLIFDVDHFKQFNDIYGHLEGDDCLRRVATAARTVVHRSSDLLARYGGEEFVVVLPYTDLEGARQIAEQIRQAVEQTAIPHSGSSHRTVTISAGCATREPGLDQTYSVLIAAADSALYCAKSGGRNLVVAAPKLP